jgi:hypothetical protein
MLELPSANDDSLLDPPLFTDPIPRRRGGADPAHEARGDAH